MGPSRSEAVSKAIEQWSHGSPESALFDSSHAEILQRLQNAWRTSWMAGAPPGRGLEAVAAEESYALAAEMLSPRAGRQCYLLRVVGQWMTEAGIEDGGLLVVEEEEDPAEGEIVVALLSGGEEVTVKRIYRERGSEGENVRLRAQNGDREDIVVSPEEVRIQGRVEYVIHRPRR
jgi:SOS-response transcriptional repressor LexA